VIDVPRHLNLEELRNGFRHLARRLDIFLNGEPVHDVVAYDCDAGTVTRHKRDHNGDRIIDVSGEKLETETLSGDVRVRYREHA